MVTMYEYLLKKKHEVQIVTENSRLYFVHIFVLKVICYIAFRTTGQVVDIVKKAARSYYKTPED